MHLPVRTRFAARRSHIWLASLMLATTLGLAGPPAFASAGDSPDQKPDELVNAEKALDHNDYAKAIQILEPYLRQNPKDADALTDLGVAYLDSGDTPKAIGILEQSLALESSKLETNAALGKAYLVAGNLPAAEKRLERIDGLCFFGCFEERQLKAEIASYRAKR